MFVARCLCCRRALGPSLAGCGASSAPGLCSVGAEEHLEERWPAGEVEDGERRRRRTRESARKEKTGVRTGTEAKRVINTTVHFSIPSYFPLPSLLGQKRSFRRSRCSGTIARPSSVVWAPRQPGRICSSCCFSADVCALGKAMCTWTWCPRTRHCRRWIHPGGEDGAAPWPAFALPLQFRGPAPLSVHFSSFLQPRSTGDRAAADTVTLPLTPTLASATFPFPPTFGSRVFLQKTPKYIKAKRLFCLDRIWIFICWPLISAYGIFQVLFLACGKKRDI